MGRIRKRFPPCPRAEAAVTDPFEALVVPGDEGEPEDLGPAQATAARRFPPLPVLARGDGYIVVAKPPRVIVHRNPKMPHVPAVLQRVRTMVGARVYLAHRLDRGASGCLLLATRQELAGPLSAAVTSPLAQKTYLAFVRGDCLREGPFRVETPIPSEYGPKEAASTVEVLGHAPEPRCSLLRVQPETGRHHQVRRHVRDVNHPIIGDADHGDSRVNRWWREQHGLNRLGLHCLRLVLPLPDGQTLDITCPLFEDQAQLFRQLPWWEQARAAELALDLPPLSMDWVGQVT